MTFNVTNPVVKKALTGSAISVVDNVVDFKVRSKLYISFTEAMTNVHEDFEQKLDQLNIDEDHAVKVLSVMNPSIMNASTDLMAALVEKFGHQSIKTWDDDCCGVTFFIHVLSGSSENDIEDVTPNDWMLKYEVFYSDDGMEISKNGDFALMSAMKHMSSTYH